MAATVGRVLLIPKGNYSGSATYNMLDWVRYNGIAWVCKVDGTSGITPTEGANWTVLAQDGSVSGSVEWSAINDKPFDDVDTTDDFSINQSGDLKIKRDTFGTMRIVSGGTTTNLEASGDSVFEIDAGTNITINADDTANPKKITINSSGGGGGGGAWGTITGTLSNQTDLQNALDEKADSSDVPTSFSDLDDTSISNPQADQIVQYKAVGGHIVLQNTNMPQGGHTMSPTPSASLTEAQVASAVNAATATNDNVASLFGIQKWSNEKRIRKVITGTTPIGSASIGSTGIGTWTDKDPSEIVAADEADWWYDAAFQIGSGNDIDLSIKFDPSTNEPIVLGGYILDTTTGKICIKFGNEIATPTAAKVAVDITVMRNEYS